MKKESVGGDGFDCLFDADGVGAEQVVAEGEGAGVDGLAETRPVGPVVFRETVFDADDGVFSSQLAVKGDEFFASQFASGALLKSVVSSFCVVKFR